MRLRASSGSGTRSLKRRSWPLSGSSATAISRSALAAAAQGLDDLLERKDQVEVARASSQAVGKPGESPPPPRTAEVELGVRLWKARVLGHGSLSVWMPRRSTWQSWERATTAWSPPPAWRGPA